MLMFAQGLKVKVLLELSKGIILKVAQRLMVNLIGIEHLDQLVLEVLLEEYGKEQRCLVTWVQKK